MIVRRVRCTVVGLLTLVVLTSCCYFFLYFPIRNGKESLRRRQGGQNVFIAVVACGQRLQETLTMIKSALLFKTQQENLNFIIFSEKELFLNFKEKLSIWQNFADFNFELHELYFPENNEVTWKSLFKPCASQRLFLPSVLQRVDSVLYVDTDVIFLSPTSVVWDLFKQFNGSQLSALTSEHEDVNIGWYNRFARHPFYGKFGINSGMMLMNLTRMRDFNWESKIEPIYKEFKLRITWGDQDILNILFYYHPDKLKLIPCEFNYRPDHCMYTNVCSSSSSGIKVLHGNRGYFHSSKQPIFQILYNAIEKYQLGTPSYLSFYIPLEKRLKSISNEGCGVIVQEVLNSISPHFEKTNF